MFKPKYGKKPYLPLPASFNRIRTFQRQNVVIITVALFILYFLFNPFKLFLANDASQDYPPAHPLTSSHVIETTSKYIYPRIEDTQLLQELTVHQLVIESKVRDANFPEIEKNLIRPLNIFDNKDASVQKAKEDEENESSDLLKAKNYFKNHDKVVYRPKNPSNYPDIVVVTAIDFEKYSVGALTKIVQNRIDYAHIHGYGVYVRWYQEFLPVLNSLSYLKSKEKSKWVRLYCLRAAMFAFPNAKWFWYIDEDGFVMDLSIDIQRYILDNDALGPIMLREKPIIPPYGAIKTYKNTKADSVKLIVTQSESKVETSSFLIKNDQVGKSIVEIWADQLYLTYPGFPYGPDSGLTHILQWHPFILSKTSLIPPKTIAARHNFKSTTPDKQDPYAYHEGDLIAQWTDCNAADECEKVLNFYHSKLTPSS